MSTEREITEKFKEAFDSKNVEILLPHLADDMTYELLPSTVGSKQEKDKWLVELKKLLGIAGTTKLDIKSIVENPKFVVVQAIVNLDFPIGPFSQDVLIIISFKEERGALKIASVVEYVDSFKVKELKAKMASRAQSS